MAERLLDRADVVVEGFRPGVVERLGLGPQECRARNPALVYARMTGWGQGGPLSASAGHDINYLGLTGALHAMGRPGQPPAPPLNLVADFGGGGAFLAIGVLAALHERHRSGQGQVLDVAMSDGAALLTAYIHGLRRTGDWVSQRGRNRLDGGAPYYDTYATADGSFLAVGAIEPQFFEQFLEGLELDHRDFDQGNPADWPRQKRIIADRIGSRTRAAWTERFESLDACVTPVLRWDEVGDHPHHVARGTFEEHDGHLEPAPAPRLARTPAVRRSSPPRHGEHTREILHELRIDPSTVERWFARGDVA